MLAFAEGVFRGANRTGGHADAAHIRVARLKGHKFQDEQPADDPSPPEGLAYLWGWYCELHNRRRRGFGPDPITWPDLEAWARVTGIHLMPSEARMIMRLDDLYLRIAAEDAERQAKQPRPKP